MEELSLEEMKEKLMERLQQGGKLGTLKAGIRKLMFHDLSEGGQLAVGSQKSLSQIALDTVVLEYLKAAKYHFSTSVFVSEANLTSSSVNKLTLDDAHKVLADLDTTHDCIRPLLQTLLQVRRAGYVDSEVQAGEQDVFRLDYKLQQIDEDFKMLRLQQKEPSVTERMRRFEEEQHEASKKTIAEEVERFKRHELSQVRLEEAAKYEKKLAEKVRELSEQDRKMHHEVQMEKYELQSRQRAIEFQAMQLEKERVEYTQALQARESSMTTVQKELIAKDTRMQQLDVQLETTRAELRTNRELCSELQMKQHHYTSEIARMQSEHDVELQKRADEWSRWHKERSQIIMEFERKTEESDLLLQNRTEEMRREFESKKRAANIELEKAKSQLRAEEESLRENVEKEVKAGFSCQITELQERQAEFCRSMVEAQMKLDQRRQELDKDAKLFQHRKVKPRKNVREHVSPRRIQKTRLKETLLNDTPDLFLEESSPSTPGTDDIIQIVRAQNKRNYQLLGEAAPLPSPHVRHGVEAEYAQPVPKRTVKTQPQEQYLPRQVSEKPEEYQARLQPEVQYPQQQPLAQERSHPKQQHQRQDGYRRTPSPRQRQQEPFYQQQEKQPQQQPSQDDVPLPASIVYKGPTSPPPTPAETEGSIPASAPASMPVSASASPRSQHPHDAPHADKEVPEATNIPSSNSSPSPPSPSPVLPPTEDEAKGRMEAINLELSEVTLICQQFTQQRLVIEEAQSRVGLCTEWTIKMFELCEPLEVHRRGMLVCEGDALRSKLSAQQKEEHAAFPNAQLEMMKRVAEAKAKREEIDRARREAEIEEEESVELEPFQESSSESGASENKWVF